jgi:hypothetical protein
MCQRFVVVFAFILLAGCVDSQPAPATSPLKKTTDKIGEFDPNAGDEVVKPDVKITNPITGPLEAYGPLVQQIAAMGIDHAIGLFYATEGRYPNSYDEFMTRIIKENNMRLPVMPAGLEYQYDVENHKLVVIQSADAKSK